MFTAINWSRLSKTTSLRLAPFLILVGVFVLIPKVPNVGDGAEYYAMTVAVNTTHKPYVTPSVWKEYESLRQQETILALPPASGIGTLGKISDGVQQDDFPHFWLYSACTALIYHLSSPFCADYSTAFYLFHCILLIGLMLFANQVWPAIGPWAVLLLFACSPLLWFSNKIHSELFTFVCTAFAAACLFRRQLLWASLALAIATTQNLPWGAIVLGLLLAWFILRRSDPITYGDCLLILTIVVICLIHPLYFLSRHGTLTPQLLHGGATLAKETTRAEFFAPLVDLDIGLFPNWPLGILFFLVCLFIYFKRTHFPQSIVNACFAFAAILFLLFSQSRTDNINSGATVNVSRYGLWYVGLFLPGVASILENLAMMKLSQKSLIGVTVVAILAASSIYQYRPLVSNPQSYTQPTYISNFAQNHLPNIYNPPWEIFSERFGKLDEDFIVRRSWAISTQSGRKMLIRPEFSKQYNRENILGLESWFIPQTRLAAFITTHKTVPEKGGFVTFTDQELTALNSRPTIADTQSTVVGPINDQFFGAGWWQGTSENRIAKIESANIIFSATRNFNVTFEIDLSGYAAVNGSWKTSIQLNGKQIGLAHGERFVKQRVSLNGLVTRGLNTLTFESDGIQSPAQVGENSDSRLLGTVFYRLTIQAVPVQ